LSYPRLILASGSPRRRELLALLGLPFEIRLSGVSEDSRKGACPVEVARELAALKAGAVAGELRDGLVVGADTLVILGREILGKPADAAEAVRMLRSLRGRTHQVVTGVAVVDVPRGLRLSSAVASEVAMSDYSDQAIAEYVASGEPFDKAGSYAVQGLGGALVSSVKGCYNNVVGFPLCEAARLLGNFGVKPATSDPVCLLPSGEPCGRF
jgi:septum formation protein